MQFRIHHLLLLAAGVGALVVGVQANFRGCGPSFYDEALRDYHTEDFTGAAAKVDVLIRKYPRSKDARRARLLQELVRAQVASRQGTAPSVAEANRILNDVSQDPGSQEFASEIRRLRAELAAR